MKENIEKKKNRPIGVMDSGVGGLTVLKQMLKLCPNEKYLYFGDTKNLPYGDKTKDQLINIVKKVFDFYQEKNAKAVIMACNTTSATAYEELKNDYDFTIYPIIQIVAQSLSKDKNLNKIAVMATQATINSHKYYDEFKKNNVKIKVLEQACPLWVPIVENKLQNYDEKAIMTEYLEKVISFDPDKVILGCTHYPYLLDKISKYAKQELFINPSEIFANYIKTDLEQNDLLSTEPGYVEYFSSSNPKEFKENAKMFLEIDSLPELVTI